ncbi:MAG: YidC/Oxa1 family membrane protein insertase [Candidatus Falkowbacteria bacterium]
MSNLYQIICYQPILNILAFLYNNTADLGVSIILLTVIIKLVLWPLSQKAIKSQTELQAIQPKIEELKKKYADNKTELGKATMDLYKEHKINPLSSCLPLLIQLPFLFAVFRVLRVGLKDDLGLVYSFLSKPEHFQAISFGFMDLSKPVIYLAVLAGLAQFIQGKMMLSKQKNANISQPAAEENMTNIMNKQMTYIFPIMTVVFGLSLPGGLTLYWFMFTALTVLQQFLVLRLTKKADNSKLIEGEIIK